MRRRRAALLALVAVLGLTAMAVGSGGVATWAGPHRSATSGARIMATAYLNAVPYGNYAEASPRCPHGASALGGGVVRRHPP